MVVNEFETLLHNSARHESTLGSLRQSQAMNLGVSVAGVITFTIKKHPENKITITIITVLSH
jgi:hypothetical protein